MTNQQYTAQAARALQLAEHTAEENYSGYIGTEHILAGLIRESHGTAAMILAENGVSYEKLIDLIDDLVSLKGDQTVVHKPEYTPKSREILKSAAEEAAHMKKEKTGTGHILLALLKEPQCMATKLLYTMQISIRDMYAEIMKTIADVDGMPDLAQEMPDAEQNSGTTPMLDKFSRDLTEMARERKLDPLIGRSAELERIIQILSRRTKNNPCLIGEPGVGKTAIVEGLAQRIASGMVPEIMRGKRLVSLDLSGMVAGTKYRGEFEQRIKKIIQEAAKNRNVLLFIDEIHTIIGAGGAEGALDASNIMKPSLSRGEIQVIGATTIEEYRKHIEKDAALERRFQPVTVEEPSQEETVEILKGLRPYYEQHHHVTITDAALETAVKMGVRYINDRYLPDKAIDLMDEAASRVQIASGGGSTDEISEKDREYRELRRQKEEAVRRGEFAAVRELQERQNELNAEISQIQAKSRKKQKTAERVVDEETIARTVSVWTKIPLERIAEAESKKLARLEEILHRRVVGQDEAVKAVARAIRRGRVGLKDPKRPVGSFLFLGPTGVGKTELSKALAEAVFGSEDALIRVDMSEYMEKHSVSKLIGSPPGYVGYEEGGQLSEKVRRHPYSVLLFDEIEKAHPDVFNILLQVLDDGRITDAQGRSVSFKETCIIMTSNAGANRIVQPKHLGFGAGEDEKQNYDNMKNQVMEEVRNMFRPEFLNRIDDIIVFHPLNQEDMKKIVNILLKDLKTRCENAGIHLRVSEKVKEKLIRDSYDSKYGARPLKRAIQTAIEDPLAEKILRDEVSKDGVISVRMQNDAIVFRNL